MLRTVMRHSPPTHSMCCTRGAAHNAIGLHELQVVRACDLIMTLVISVPEISQNLLDGETECVPRMISLTLDILQATRGFWS